MSRLTKEEAFQVLELDHSSSSSDDIRKAYLRLARKHHPDKSSVPDAEELFKSISNAYQRLTDDADISDKEDTNEDKHDEDADCEQDTDYYAFFREVQRQQKESDQAMKEEKFRRNRLSALFHKRRKEQEKNLDEMNKKQLYLLM